MKKFCGLVIRKKKFHDCISSMLAEEDRFFTIRANLWKLQRFSTANDIFFKAMLRVQYGKNSTRVRPRD